MNKFTLFNSSQLNATFKNHDHLFLPFKQKDRGSRSRNETEKLSHFSLSHVKLTRTRSTVSSNLIMTAVNLTRTRLRLKKHLRKETSLEKKTPYYSTEENKMPKTGNFITRKFILLSTRYAALAQPGGEKYSAHLVKEGGR